MNNLKEGELAPDCLALKEQPILCDGTNKFGEAIANQFLEYKEPKLKGILRFLREIRFRINRVIYKKFCKRYESWLRSDYGYKYGNYKERSSKK